MCKRILVRGKGIYDPVGSSMESTGLLIEAGKVVERGVFETLRQREPQIEILDYREQYILPGLINTHVHLSFTPGKDTYKVYKAQTEEERIEHALISAEAMLKSGVTTVRDAGSSMDLVKRIRRGNHNRKLPRLQLAGPPVTIRGGHLHFLGADYTADSAEEIREGIKRRKEEGCSCIKIIASGGRLTPDSKPYEDQYTQREITTAAEASEGMGLPIMSHCLTMSSLVYSLRAGVTSIEHCACFRYDTDLSSIVRFFEPEKLENQNCAGRFFMPGLLNNYPADDKEEYQIVKCLIGMGMEPVTGTDGGCGWSLFDETWREIKLLSEYCGLSCGQALRSATYMSAMALGRGNDLGHLDKGCEADFITMYKNPLKDLDTLSEIVHVVMHGEIIK